MSLALAAIAATVVGGTLLIVRRGKPKPKKKRPGTAVPAEPTTPGQVVTWHRNYYTLVVEYEDTPGLPKFTWGVLDTAGLRKVTAAGAPPNFQEALDAGYCFGIGTAETYDEATREAQLWSDTIREPLEHSETLATAIEGVLLVVSPRPQSSPTDPIYRWMVYAFPASSWPQWATGQLPGPNDAMWQMEELSQDGALGQGVLYARTHALEAVAEPEGIQIGARAANTDQTLEWTGRPGASSLVAVGRRGRPAAGTIGDIAVGALRRPPSRPTVVRRRRRVRVTARGRKPPGLRWVGDTIAWWHHGLVLVLERTGKRGPRAFGWAAFDAAGLQQTGWDLFVATARGYRLGTGFASSTALAVAEAQAFANKYFTSHAGSRYR